MNVAGTSEVKIQDLNVLSLFTDLETHSDPLQDILNEGMLQTDETSQVIVKRFTVQENQFPDQSMYILDKQLSSLKESMGRLKFYLSDLDDLLPR